MKRAAGLMLAVCLPPAFLYAQVVAYDSCSYTYSPDDFQVGSEFRIQIIDARKPDEVHKELVFTADSPLIQQLRSDFSYGPHMLITTVH